MARDDAPRAWTRWSSAAAMVRSSAAADSSGVQVLRPSGNGSRRRLLTLERHAIDWPIGLTANLLERCTARPQPLDQPARSRDVDTKGSMSCDERVVIHDR